MFFRMSEMSFNNVNKSYANLINQLAIDLFIDISLFIERYVGIYSTVYTSSNFLKLINV